MQTVKNEQTQLYQNFKYESDDHVRNTLTILSQNLFENDDEYNHQQDLNVTQ